MEGENLEKKLSSGKKCAIGAGVFLAGIILPSLGIVTSVMEIGGLGYAAWHGRGFYAPFLRETYSDVRKYLSK